MIKRFFNKFNLFWKIYFFLFFLCSIGGIFIPWDNDIIWVWIWLFYIPFSFYLVYPYGFIMGIIVQSKLTGTAKEILLLSIIYFILVLILTLVSGGLNGILINNILYNIDFKLYSTLGSTLLFVVGAFIVKFMQRK